MRLEQSLREANAKIQQLSETDSLLGTFNRRYLSTQIVREVDRARRYKHPLAAVMADLDHFKRVNDERGHQTGDEVLRHFAELSKASVRPSDWIARYGGEEFVIVLPETNLAGAVIAAEKLRALCAGKPFCTSSGELAITASFGVAELRIDADSQSDDAAAQTLLRRADAALYTSKSEGRDRVTAAQETCAQRSVGIPKSA